MPTFIDRLETDLVQACDASIAPARSWPSLASLSRRALPALSRRATLRTLSGLALVAAITTPAIAIGLSPILRAFEGQAVTTSAEAPPAEQLTLLGILRDPQPGATVDPATLGPVFLSGLKGVRTNYIRRLPPAPGFPSQLLYTVTSGDFGAAQFNSSVGASVPTEATNLICVQQVGAHGVGGDCSDTSVLTSGRWLESAGLNGYGLVPDGVASVILNYPDHPAQTETVSENTFSWQGYPGPSGPVTNGAGQSSPGLTPEFRPALPGWTQRATSSPLTRKAMRGLESAETGAGYAERFYPGLRRGFRY